MSLSDRIGLRWYLFKTSKTLRVIVVGIAVVCAAGVVADHNGALPRLAPIVFGLIALIAAMLAMLALSWSNPPADKAGARSAATVRNIALAITGILIVGMAMFTVGAGGFPLRRLWPVLIIAAEFALMAFMAHRAFWYGTHPDARKELIEDRKAAVAARRAEAAGRLARRRADRAVRDEPTTAVQLVEVTDVPIPARPAAARPASAVPARPVPARPASAVPASARPFPVVEVHEPQSPRRPNRGDDDLDLVDLTGGDDDYGDDDADEVEILDREGKRV